MNEVREAAGHAVAMTGMAKAFGGVVALEHVDFFVVKGEIHALLGATARANQRFSKCFPAFTSRTAGKSASMA